MIIVFVAIILLSWRGKNCAESEFVPPGSNPAAITVIALNSDDIKTTHHRNGAYFDHDADGFAEQTGWVLENDGILVLDLNHNGIIENGREIFGHCITDKMQINCGGLMLLNKYDKNSDGKIDPKDEIYSNLRVWLDFNGDGHCDPDELVTLEALKIKAIRLDYRELNQKDATGNILIRVGQYENMDGTTGQIGDCLVRRDKTYAISSKWLYVPRKINELPDISGVGPMKTLHRAMLTDESGKLIQLVRRAVAENDPATRTAIFEQLLFRWAGVDHITPTSRGLYIDARRLALEEKVLKSEFAGIRSGANPNQSAASLLNTAYLILHESLYARFMAESHLKDIYSLFRRPGEFERIDKPDLSRAIFKLQTVISADEERGKIILKEFIRTVQGFRGSQKIDDLDIQNAFKHYGSDLACIGTKRMIRGDEKERNTLYGSPGPDIITGGGAADYISGGLCDDELYGVAGNDSLYGDFGNDILDGGTGDDDLYGGTGKDAYVFGKGYGYDCIIDDDSGNTVKFKEGMAVSDVTFHPMNSDLLIRLNNKDKLRIQDWLGRRFYTVDKFIFPKGTILSPADVISLFKKPPRSTIWEKLSFIDLYMIASAVILCVLVSLNVWRRRAGKSRK